MSKKLKKYIIDIYSNSLLHIKLYETGTHRQASGKLLLISKGNYLQAGSSQNAPYIRRMTTA